MIKEVFFIYPQKEAQIPLTIVTTLTTRSVAHAIALSRRALVPSVK